MENRELYLDYDGIKLHTKLDFPADDRSRYPLVIVAHGLTGHMEEPHIQAITKALNENGYATLRVEFYGHGGSGGEFADHTILHWELELMAIIDHAKQLDFVTDLYLTGHSQGGVATVLTAALKSDALKAIIPLAPATVVKDMSLAGDFLGTTFDPKHIPEKLLLFGDSEKLISGNYFRVNQTLPIQESASRYKKPVLIVHSDTDEMVPVRYSEELATWYENVTLKIIPGDDHGFSKHIDLVTKEIIAFLAQINK